MTKPEAVVFDIGNVLLEWQPEAFYDRMIGADRRAALFAAVDLHAMNEAVDLGAALYDTVAARAAQHPDWADEIMIWHDHWAEMASPVIPGGVKILESVVAAGVPAFALSNFGRDTWEQSLRRYPFLELFDRTYISGRLGVMKPAAEIYAHVEEDCGIAPSRLIFTDDKAENIEAAKARGWKGHIFDGPDGWARRLRDEGLLTR